MNTLFFLWYAHSLRKIKFKFKINNVESYQRESNLCHSYPKLHVLLNKYLQYSHPITTIKLDTKKFVTHFSLIPRFSLIHIDLVNLFYRPPPCFNFNPLSIRGRNIKCIFFNHSQNFKSS